ncbi:MAG: hypothetical protein AAGH42_05880 [Pseudomonadota bacterium]
MTATTSTDTETPIVSGGALADGSPAPTVQRVDSLDMLRGFAVLMIFVVNIKMMANGYNHYANRFL